MKAARREIELLSIVIMTENSQHCTMKMICIKPSIFSCTVNDPVWFGVEREYSGKRSPAEQHATPEQVSDRADQQNVGSRNNI